MTATTNRGQIVLLGVLLVILAGALMYALGPVLWGREVAGPAAALPAAGQVKTPATPSIDVRLDKLAAGAGTPSESGRNPFRMGQATPPPSAGVSGPGGGTARAAGPAPSQPAAPIGPPGPPPVPPIPYKFIGIVSGPGGIGRIAVLSDGKTVVHGRENDIVDGRYRIVRIAEESLQIEHVDGRGRQTLRLSGA
jgi:hypothetical protein